jgi:hypothetical protein
MAYKKANCQPFVIAIPVDFIDSRDAADTLSGTIFKKGESVEDRFPEYEEVEMKVYTFEDFVLACNEEEFSLEDYFIANVYVECENIEGQA